MHTGYLCAGLKAGLRELDLIPMLAVCRRGIAGGLQLRDDVASIDLLGALIRTRYGRDGHLGILPTKPLLVVEDSHSDGKGKTVTDLSCKRGCRRRREEQVQRGGGH